MLNSKFENLTFWDVKTPQGRRAMRGFRVLKIGMGVLGVLFLSSFFGRGVALFLEGFDKVGDFHGILRGDDGFCFISGFWTAFCFRDSFDAF
ncbi:MAG: hypothetical protein ACJAVK_001548 [Akkermansiaceae bacterium]